MMATRYLPAIAVLLALALVPTIIHSYSADLATDGRSTNRVPMTLAGYDAVPGDRDATWGKRRFDSDDWFERAYRSGGNKVIVAVVRTYDAKRVYHHPELAVAYHRASFAGEEVQYFEPRPDIPVHVLKEAPGERPGLGMYALHYDDEFIDNPLAFQIRMAAELLFSRRKPMTLFFVLDEDMTGGAEAAYAAARTLLFGAIEAFLR